MRVDVRRAWLRSIAAMLVVVSFAPARASEAASARIARTAAAWLAEQQHASGAFGGDEQPADQVADAMATLAAAGIDGEVRARALSLIRRDGPARAQQGAGFAARIVLGLVAVGEDPRDFDGIDYVAEIHAPYNELLGTHGGNLYSEALAGLGRLAAGETLPPAYLDRLQGAQCPGGGYAYSDRCGRSPDADTTSLVLSVLSLAGAGNDAPAIAPSLQWLRALQTPSGAFPLEATFDPNANSTGLVITMLGTLGIDARTWRRNADPIQALAAFATEEGALAFTHGGRANLWATVQGIPGLLSESFPLRARNRATTTTADASASPRAADQPTASVAVSPTPPRGTRSPSPVSATPRPSTIALAASATPDGVNETPRPGAGMWLWGPGILILFFGSLFVAFRRRMR